MPCSPFQLPWKRLFCFQSSLGSNSASRLRKLICKNPVRDKMQVLTIANDPNSNNIEKDNRNSFHIKWHRDITKRPKGLLRHIRYDEVSLFHNPIKYILLLPGQRISLAILWTPLCRSLLNRGSSATSYPGSLILPPPWSERWETLGTRLVPVHCPRSHFNGSNNFYREVSVSDYIYIYISNTRDSASSGYTNTAKRVENTTKFEVFG